MPRTLPRRTFLGAAVVALASIPLIREARSSGLLYINGHADPTGRHVVSGFTEHGEERFRIPLPGKAHGFAVNPHGAGNLVCLPTLPGTRALVVDASSGSAQGELRCPDGNHFNGHACFSLDGGLIYTTENRIEGAEGVIGVYDALTLNRSGELPAYGIGPHDIRLHPNGSDLVVASGGIATHPKTGKHELNINTMVSALVYVDRLSGEMKQRLSIPIPRLSIRHLDVAPDGTVLVACQYKGRSSLPPLVGIQRGAGAIKMLEVPDANLWTLQNYTASIRVAAQNRAVVSCPRGNALTLWDIRKGQFLRSFSIPDVGGIECDPLGTTVMASANTGELYSLDLADEQIHKVTHTWRDAKWTNHMTRLQI
ncbi:MAG: DUF1513 domain-containing protein [Pseudomonadota bacterium]